MAPRSQPEVRPSQCIASVGGRALAELPVRHTLGAAHVDTQTSPAQRGELVHSWHTEESVFTSLRRRYNRNVLPSRLSPQDAEVCVYKKDLDKGSSPAGGGLAAWPLT